MDVCLFVCVCMIGIVLGRYDCDDYGFRFL